MRLRFTHYGDYFIELCIIYPQLQPTLLTYPLADNDRFSVDEAGSLTRKLYRALPFNNPRARKRYLCAR